MNENISFETYSTDKIDAQVQLVNNIAKSWTAFGYPDAKALKNAYVSNPDFTPETRHYMYDNKKLVGFLSSAVESEKDGKLYGSIQYPFLLKEYKSFEKELMNRAIEVLKAKGVAVITTNLYHLWGDAERIINDYNYQEQETWDMFAIIDKEKINSLQLENSFSEVTEFNPTTDSEKLFEAYFVPNNISRERFDRFIANVKTSQTLISLPVVIRNGKLKAFTRMEYEEDVKSLFTFHVNCFDLNDEQSEKDRASILSYICAKASNYEDTSLYIYIGPNPDRARKYEKLGIHFETIKTYKMEVN
ncbi:MAG: hypothetical protein ACXAD7_01830 [Candidatus Kariarchaeaceae archaeon]|jgi:hypothetical protein